MTDKTPDTCGSDSSTELGPLVEVLAAWEDQNGTMAAILPSEWDALKQDVMDACVVQSPRMLRHELALLKRLHAVLQDYFDATDAAWLEICQQAEMHGIKSMHILPGQAKALDKYNELHRVFGPNTNSGTPPVA
jgi:hypothetical protein